MLNSSPFETTSLTVFAQRRGDDRVAVFEVEERVVLVVADGAGGMGDGDQAAETVIREVQVEFRDTTTAAGWARVLSQIDFRIGTGQSTAVVVDVAARGICGASVGDSRAWMIEEGESRELTAGQCRKPLLGSGAAQPVGFIAGVLVGTIVVATDGLWNYMKREMAVRLVVTTEFAILPRKLVESVRLPSGELWDDVGIVVCRRRPRPRPGKRRYEIDTLDAQESKPQTLRARPEHED